MIFGVDALGAWLVEQLADASRKKLTALILGDEQERALRQAATAAIRATAAELSQADGERAEQLTMVISQVFGDPAPDPPPAGEMMLLESLQAQIAGQLAVLDDASLTQSGQSSADVLGVPGAVLADRLTRHLVREIMLRGSRGGALTSLASELNHELTRLQGRRIEMQGQRVESMLAVLAAEICDTRALPRSRMAPAGRPLEEVTDPFALEVHRPVQPKTPQPGLSALPTYVPREHDAKLGAAVRAVMEGRSAIAVLVGGSSTGKTRACWEALQSLRGQPGLWRLWHPIDPSRPDAALRELPRIGPRTVVWLNEAQFYLDIQEGGLGERVAAGLRELLRDPTRTPVLVLATLWPQFWDALISRPAGHADPHAQARELLVSHDIAVPAAFTVAQMEQLRNSEDSRLTQAAEAAEDGQVIQFLAGGPELLARYRNAPSAAAAIINAAMDARRLGTGILLSQAFLEAAAPGYLTDTEWDALREDWLEEALAYTAVPCKGVRGPLTRIRPRPIQSRLAGSSARDSGERPPSELVGPLYRLADYLDQYARLHRSSVIPPTGFWAAAVCRVSSADQAVLGDAAHDRGLYRAAAQLHKNAAARGNLRAASYLSNPPPYLHADTGPTYWAVAHATLDDAFSVAMLLDSVRRAGLQEQAAALTGRAAALVAVDDPFGTARLLASVRRAGLQEQAAVLAGRAAARVPLHNLFGVDFLLDELQAAGLQEQAALLAGRVAAVASLDDPSDVARLLASVRGVGLQEQVAALAGRIGALVPIDDPSDVAPLLDELRAVGLQQQAAVLAERAAAHTALNNPRGVARLLGSLRAADLRDQAATLLRRDPVAHIPLDNPSGVAFLLDELQAAGLEEQVAVLAGRAAAQAALDNPRGVARLLASLQVVGLHQQVALLAGRAAAYIPLDDPPGLAWLLYGLRRIGLHEQVAVLAGRAAAQAALDNPRGVARLLASLQVVGLPGQAATLAQRAAVDVPLDSPSGIAQLLVSLREAGFPDRAVALLHRDAAAHVTLDDPRGVAELLGELQAAGLQGQVAVLAGRAAAHGALTDPQGVAELLGRLRAAGLEEQATALIHRLPAAGMFELFCVEQGRQHQFRFGRQLDGSPAEPWGWEDLE